MTRVLTVDTADPDMNPERLSWSAVVVDSSLVDARDNKLKFLGGVTLLEMFACSLLLSTECEE